MERTKGSAEEKWLKIMDWQKYISKLNIIFWHLCAVNSATVGALLSKKYIRVPHPNPDVSVSAHTDYGLTVRAFIQPSVAWSKWNMGKICGLKGFLHEEISNYFFLDHFSASFLSQKY